MNRQLLFIPACALALGMFVQTSFLFLDYVYGFEYGLIVYGVILTSLMLSILKPGWANKFARAWIYASSVCMAMFGLLAEISINNHVIYFTLLYAAIILCSLLLGFALQSRIQYCRISTLIPGVIVGMYAAYYLVLELDSVFSVLLLAAAIIILSITLTVEKLKIVDFLSITTMVLVLLMLNNMLVKSQMPAWKDKNATKPMADYLLQDNAVNTGDVDWTHYGRIDKTAVLDEGREIAYSWRFINGNSATPLGENIEQDQAALSKKYPLLTLPLKATNPENILIVGEQNAVAAAIKDSNVSNIDLLLLSDPHNTTDKQYSATSVTDKVGKINSTGTKYNLIHLAAPVEVSNTWLQGSIQGVVFLNKEMLEWYMNQLSDDGVIAIVVKDEIVFNQVLVNLWQLLGKEGDVHVNNLSSKLKAYKLNKYASNRGIYDYLILASGSAIPDGIASKIDKEVRVLPVEVVIYNNNTAGQPYNIISSRNLDTDKSILQLRKHLSRQLGINVNLYGSSVWQPLLYNITSKPHTYLVAIFTITMLISVYGVVIARNSRRNIANNLHFMNPAVSVMLLQSMASIIAIVVLAMIHIMLSTASLGMGNVVIVNTVSIILIGYYLGQYFEQIMRAVGLGKGGTSWGILIFLSLVSLGWGYLSGLELSRLLENWSYWLMCILLFMSAVVTGCLHKCVMQRIKTTYFEFEAWTRILTGLGVMHGVLIFTWLLMGRGLIYILIYVFMLYAYLLIVHFWLSNTAGVDLPAREEQTC